MPVVPVYDLAYDPNARRILAGTHGRSMMSYSMDSIHVSTDNNVHSSITNINIYPNPASEYIKVNINSIKGMNASISILTQEGKLLQKSERKINGSFIIPVNDFAPGTYFLRIKGERVDAVKKFVKL